MHSLIKTLLKHQAGSVSFQMQSSKLVLVVSKVLAVKKVITLPPPRKSHFQTMTIRLQKTNYKAQYFLK